MYKELCLYLYEPYKTPEDYQKSIFFAIKSRMNGICLPIHILRKYRDIIPGNIKIAVPIDWPYGQLDCTLKITLIMQAVKAGATTVDIVLNDYKRYNNHNQFVQELQLQLDVCEQNKIIPRPILNYTLYDNQENIFLAKLLQGMGVCFAIPTTGDRLDNFEDNLAISYLISKESNLNMVFNGRITTEKQWTTVKSSKIFGARFHSEVVLSRFIQDGVI